MAKAFDVNAVFYCFDNHIFAESIDNSQHKCVARRTLCERSEVVQIYCSKRNRHLWQCAIESLWEPPIFFLLPPSETDDDSRTRSLFSSGFRRPNFFAGQHRYDTSNSRILVLHRLESVVLVNINSENFISNNRYLTRRLAGRAAHCVNMLHLHARSVDQVEIIFPE